MNPPIVIGKRKFLLREVTVELVYFARSKSAQVNLQSLLIADDLTSEGARKTWKQFCVRAFKHGWLWKIFGLPRPIRLSNIAPKDFSGVIESFFTHVREATKASNGGTTSSPAPSADTPQVPQTDTMLTT